MLESKIVTDVVSEPVTTAEAKSFMVIDSTYTADDTLIGGFITSARLILEKYTNLSFGEKSLQVFTDKHYLDLPYGPISAVTEVKDQDDNIVPDTDYKLRGLDFKKIFIGSSNLDIFFPLGGGVPVFDSPVIQRYYTITYTAGYGITGGTPIPEALKLAIKEQVNHMYNTRGETEQSNEPKLCLAAKMLADPFSRRPLL